MENTIKTKSDRQRKFLLMLPVLVVPFLCIAFYTLGGGRGVQDDASTRGAGMGFNTELPAPVFSKKDEKTDKLAFYKQADADSMKRKEWMQQDPYHRGNQLLAVTKKEVKDTQATVLLEKLDLLKKRMEKQVAGKPVRPESVYRVASYKEERPEAPDRRVVDTVQADPELEQLSRMLDKIVRLKGLDEEVKQPEVGQRPVVAETKDEQVMPAAAPAVVDGDQELVNGGTIGLRLMATVVCNGVTVRKGQLVYGAVSLSNDRLHVSVHSIRVGDAILATSWQVYDLDGLQGIRVPDGLGRQVARQSVDQGVGALNLLGYDPSVGAQVTGAGIQAAKSLFSRKVKTVRVTVPAGYHVLLKDMKTSGTSIQVMTDTVSSGVAVIVPPCMDSLQDFLHQQVRAGDVCLQLRGIYKRDGVIWLRLQLTNGGALPFFPGFLQCSIGPGRHFRRMAVQTLPVQPVYDSLPGVVSFNETKDLLVGLPVFEVSRGKRLVVELGESAGGSKLVLKIGRKMIDKMK